MAPRFDIRAYRSSDLDQIHAIYGDAVLNGISSFDEEPPSRETLREKFDGLVGQNFPILVAADEAGLVYGYTYAGPYRPRSAYRFTVENSIYVGVEHRGLGVGKSLLHALLKVCQDAKFEQMVAVIGGPEPASVALHEALGFDHVGRLPKLGLKFGIWRDIVLMQKALQDQ